MRQLLVLTLIQLVLSGCTTERQIDLDAERALLLETDRAFAAVDRTNGIPLDVTFATFTDDARVLAPNAPMLQGEAWRRTWAEMVALPGYSLSFRPSLAEVSRAADFGYTIGTYRMTVPDDDGRLVEINGKYLSLWKRQPDGSWKIAVDMFNANAPPVPVGD